MTAAIAHRGESDVSASQFRASRGNPCRRPCAVLSIRLARLADRAAEAAPTASSPSPEQAAERPAARIERRPDKSVFADLLPDGGPASWRKFQHAALRSGPALRMDAMARIAITAEAFGDRGQRASGCRSRAES